MSKYTLTCAECGVSFAGTKSQWDRRNRGRSFCSRKCIREGHRKSSKAWWNANPDTNTVQRPTMPCAYCGKEFVISAHQHYNLRKDPSVNVYCTRKCLFLNTGHTDIRRHAIQWVQEHPEVGGEEAARQLGIPYATLLRWRKMEGLQVKSLEYRTVQTCGHCGKEYWPSSSQWHQRTDYMAQVCSDKCRGELASARMAGVPRPECRKHGLYSLEMMEVRRLRRAIKQFVKEGA